MEKKPVQALTPYPRGWYLAAHSDLLRVGDVKPVRLFGHDLVLFRDESGVAHLVDAYCPHLGAHLGHGGKVVGACLRCPFHGWQYEGATGQCVKTGNGDPVPPKAKLRRWPLAERAGMVLVWFHERGAAPDWEVGALTDLEEPGWSQWRDSEYLLRASIQDVSENDADVSHSPVMHGFTDALPAIEMDAAGPRCTWTLRANLKLGAFGVPVPPKVGPLARLPTEFPSEISVARWGLSVGWVRQWLSLPGGMTFRTQTLATTTPVDPDHVVLRFRHRVRKTPVGPLTRMILRNYSDLFNGTVEQDIEIWQHKAYLVRPMASKSDWAVLRFRNWSRQFYDPEEFERALDAGDAAVAR